METFLSKFFQSQFIPIQGELFDKHLQSEEKVWPPNFLSSDFCLSQHFFQKNSSKNS